MISRRATKEIEETYHIFFRDHHKVHGYNYVTWIKINELYDFLFVNNFDTWLLNLFKQINSSKERDFKEFILRLHTGESIAQATLDWSWQDREMLGQRILKDLAETLIRERLNNPDFFGSKQYQIDAVDNMRRTLELDGYVFRDGILWVPEESVVDTVEEQGLLENLMATMSLPNIPLIKHHLELSVSNFQESKWDDSISNSRKVLESVLSQTAERLGAYYESDSLSPDDLNWASRVRDYLERKNILDKKEKETISKVYSLLSELGGHPYIADRDQARLMRHLALTFSQFVLLRLDGKLKEIQTQNRLDDK